MDARLKDLRLIKTLSHKSQAALLKSARIQKARRNDTLVQQGDMLASVFLLLNGTLRIYTANAEGREATLYMLNDGEVCLLSLNAAFSNGRYPAWVSVESDAAAMALLPAGLVREMFKSEAAVQEMVLESLTGAIRDLFTHLDDVLTCRLSERIERFLMRNCDRQGRVNITHQGLANHLGVAREAVSREIGALRKRNRLASGRGYFQIAPRKAGPA